MSKPDLLAHFIEHTEAALAQERFVKLVFGAYRGSQPDLQKVLVRRIELKGEPFLQLTWRSAKSDRAENQPEHEAEPIIRRLWQSGFRSVRLFALDHDWQLEVSPNGMVRLNKAPATFPEAPDVQHDKPKQRLLDPQKPWWHALGLTSEEGSILPSRQAKWRQIEAFVELLRPHLQGQDPATTAAPVRVLDMGCGKGYLTFALAEYFRSATKLPVRLTGVEQRAELVERTKRIARRGGFRDDPRVQLEFVPGSIADCALPCDLLIALHACNTATDEAILHGIAQQARWIVCSPCCHQEVRPQLTPPPHWQGTFQHGILQERLAEWLTDSLRALYLESQGYAVKVVEYVSDEHTPRNLLLIGEKVANYPRQQAAVEEAAHLRQLFGIASQRLWA